MIAFKRARDRGEVFGALDDLRAAVRSDANLVPVVTEALEVGATVGEITGTMRQGLGVHAWAVGVIGLMCLGVWASMIRRQTGAPFEFSTLVAAAYACGFIAAVARVLAVCSVGTPLMWLLLGAFAWIAGYTLFLMGFAEELLRGRSTPP